MQLDPENKGYIKLPNFVEVAGPFFNRTRINEDNAEDIFAIFDEDKDGLVREKDLKEVLSLFGEQLSDSYIKRMVQEVDIDGDGAIGLDEYKFFVSGEIF